MTSSITVRSATAEYFPCLTDTVPTRHLPLRGTCRITLHTEPVRVLRFYKDAVWSSGDHQLVQIVLTNLRRMLMGAGEFR